MVSRSVKVRLLVWGLIATGIITVTLSWVLEGQYAHYARDVQALQKQIVWCSKQHNLLHRMPAIEKTAARLESLIATAKRKLPSGSLHQKPFLQAVEATSLQNGVTCQFLEVRHKSLGFYEWKQLKITLSGGHDAILRTLADVDRTGRLVSWEDVCHRIISKAGTRNEAVAIVKIFSYPSSDLGRDVKPIGRREIKTHTWLPPFSSDVKNLQQEAAQAYDLLMSEPGVEEKLLFIQGVKEKMIRFERMKAVLTELERRRGSLEQAIKNIGTCN
jgi:Tfp pilus assembly protein PilO